MEDKYYIELKEKALKVEVFDKARDYAKDKNKVNAYFEMGELLFRAGREYGKNIINNYSGKLMIEVGKNIIIEHYIEWENFMNYLVMKNWPQCGQN